MNNNDERDYAEEAANQAEMNRETERAWEATNADPVVEEFRVDVLAIGETTWANNALTFQTSDEAVAYAKDLYGRWTMADHMRIVPVSHPTREAYVAGSELF